MPIEKYSISEQLSNNYIVSESATASTSITTELSKGIVQLQGCRSLIEPRVMSIDELNRKIQESSAKFLKVSSTTNKLIGDAGEDLGIVYLPRLLGPGSPSYNANDVSNNFPFADNVVRIENIASGVRTLQGVVSKNINQIESVLEEVKESLSDSATAEAFESKLLEVGRRAGIIKENKYSIKKLLTENDDNDDGPITDAKAQEILYNIWLNFLHFQRGNLPEGSDQPNEWKPTPMPASDFYSIFNQPTMWAWISTKGSGASNSSPFNSPIKKGGAGGSSILRLVNLVRVLGLTKMNAEELLAIATKPPTRKETFAPSAEQLFKNATKKYRPNASADSFVNNPSGMQPDLERVESRSEEYRERYAEVPHQSNIVFRKDETGTIHRQASWAQVEVSRKLQSIGGWDPLGYSQLWSANFRIDKKKVINLLDLPNSADFTSPPKNLKMKHKGKNPDGTPRFTKAQETERLKNRAKYKNTGKRKILNLVNALAGHSSYFSELVELAGPNGENILKNPGRGHEFNADLISKYIKLKSSWQTLIAGKPERWQAEVLSKPIDEQREAAMNFISFDTIKYDPYWQTSGVNYENTLVAASEALLSDDQEANRYIEDDPEIAGLRLQTKTPRVPFDAAAAVARFKSIITNAPAYQNATIEALENTLLESLDTMKPVSHIWLGGLGIQVSYIAGSTSDVQGLTFSFGVAKYSRNFVGVPKKKDIQSWKQFVKFMEAGTSAMYVSEFMSNAQLAFTEEVLNAAASIRQTLNTYITGAVDADPETLGLVQNFVAAMLDSTLSNEEKQEHLKKVAIATAKRMDDPSFRNALKEAGLL